ncbi:MAG TPA: ATP-grasp fold amidoligase family protein [Sphingomonas sp.]|nr:ATP-grasp fold amidoligase family protein [Sphingomonas sp.]
MAYDTVAKRRIPALAIGNQAERAAPKPPGILSGLDDQTASPSVATLLRLHLTYLWRHRRVLSLDAPRLFTELVQHRKLVDRDPRIPRLIDKLAVKRFVADRLGPQWITPTLWSGDVLPTEPPCARPFVVKSRHGCRQIRVVCNATDDWQATRRAAASWTRNSYGGWLDEWGYRDVPRGLLIEPFIGVAPVLPIDYKLYVFHGRVAAIQVHLDRATNHRWTLFDRDWRRLSDGCAESGVPKPLGLGRMIEGAEILAEGFDFVRIDFYDVGETPRFGEMTFYPGSGLDPFDPPRLDALLGQYWLAGA